MRLPCLPQVAVFGLALAVAGGCGSSPSKTSESGKSASDIADKAVPELAELGETLPMRLDEDRIQVTPPKGWVNPSRSNKYVVYFQIGKSPYPRIDILAEDYEAIDKVAKDNVEEFAKQIDAALKKAGDRLTCPVKVFSFDDWAGATYQRQARDNKQILDRRVLETVVGNRKYTFELLALEGMVEKYWPHLLAVAGGVEYVKAGGEAPPPEKKPAAKTPEEPPAGPEKKPDEAAEKTPEVKTPAKKRSTFEEDF